MEKQLVQEGTTVAPQSYKITVTATGPYLIFGQPPLKQLFIMPDERGNSWTYRAGKAFSTEHEPTALCRCGASKNKPYCDGAHASHDWDPALTAPVEALLDEAETIDGPRITLTDNEKYCAFARFCDARGRVWNLAEVDDPQAREDVIREANHCLAGRLSAWDQQTGKPFEPQWPISLGLIEDPAIRSSAGIFVIGGIPISTQEGKTYEVRNRVALCRCGQSSRKPFCDGTHASFKWKDGLGGTPNGEEF
ncbi:MAG: CDGSH iron-sulfur domain-containing protein [Rikenellaceae bacterium]|jgi:CDGSH-type Zn-finger protein|nr:CDGSH iron-sulfur domain-containing protein [Rikenellaceae bacterium]